ncbi:hypothetical protein [Buchnera aphidicola]|nr:hypothetical protein [Buchnera aphidicola]
MSTNFGLNCFFKIALYYFPQLHIQKVNGNIQNIIFKNIVYKTKQLEFSIKKINVNFTKKFFHHKYIYIDLISIKDIFIYSKKHNLNINNKNIILNLIYKCLFKQFDFLCPNVKLYQIHYKDNNQHIFIDKCFSGIKSTKKSITVYTLKTNKIQLKIKNKNSFNTNLKHVNFFSSNIFNYAKKIFDLKLFYIKNFIFSQYKNIFINNFKENFFSVIENKKPFIFSTKIDFIKKKNIYILQNINLKFCNLLLHGNGFFFLNKKKFIDIVFKINLYTKKILKEKIMSIMTGNISKKIFFCLKTKGYKNIIFYINVKKKQNFPYYMYKVVYLSKQNPENKNEIKKRFNYFTYFDLENNLSIFNLYIKNKKNIDKKPHNSNHNLKLYIYSIIKNISLIFPTFDLHCKKLKIPDKVINSFKCFLYKKLLLKQKHLLVFFNTHLFLNKINNFLIKFNYSLKKNNLTSLGTIFVFHKKNHLFIPGINYFFKKNNLFIKANINNKYYINIQINIKNINYFFPDIFGSFSSFHKILFKKNNSCIKLLSSLNFSNFISKLCKIKKIHFSSNFSIQKNIEFNVLINLYNISIDKKSHFSILTEFNENVNSYHVIFQFIQKKTISEINIVKYYKNSKLKNNVFYINFYLKNKKKPFKCI